LCEFFKGDLELFEEAQANHEDDPAAAATSEAQEKDIDDTLPITVQPKAARDSPSKYGSTGSLKTSEKQV
jgi:hypothetical protein